ncbi:hypothetical protein IW140_003400 [Coemansia sp. RSA 1813]|nr:hypothetical protein EV178_003217 [Coemansia sp. RSA 1646]KAJ1771025.1 hypothetical protein LPJ74_002716 [Coemansia sp. RSA 1843]KAJ2089264.1 hypothetical protein IW138_003584 [Coemansia sp. RSA 986]KAJ2215093.1 hypothetical protein EV179_002461 [Coemansia sp. RSA 487]KAJ2569035.1 hypothetical protein IW140_003400 [Coemansia sp. RSA 1813]
MEAMYSSSGSMAASTPDVWQQLHEFQFGASLTKLFDYIAFIPIIWEASTTSIEAQSTGTSTPYRERNSRQYGSTATLPQPATTDALVAASRATGRSSIGVLPTNPGTQLFGLFVSPYFLFSIFIGFVISRIHVLVHRQRVRPLGVLARVALYAPAYILLLRAVAIDCVALSGSTLRQNVHPWMQTPVDFVSRVVQQRGIVVSDGPIASSRALWLSFSTCCIFDCIDVFVARLEGSPCAPYEYIGGLIERTSLYYFYGGSFRIQELGLLHVLEKLLLSHILIVFENGWRWRLVPTGIANMLMLHHFLFSMRKYEGPYSVYPFVQVLSMVLLGVSLVIVLTTVLIRWLAFTVDKLGMKPVGDVRRRGMADTRSSANIAIYDRSGVFQGTGADEVNDSDEMFELTQDMFIPIVPDLRRDFSVEVLDLAGTCLQQCSNKIQTNGFSRPLEAMRLPKTTALDQYVEEAVRANTSSRAFKRKGRRRAEAGIEREQQLPRKATCGARVSGLGVFIDDEPSVFGQLPGNSIDLVHIFQSTRLNSIRNLSCGMWALVVALFRYVWRRRAEPCSTDGSLLLDSAEVGADDPAGKKRTRIGKALVYGDDCAEAIVSDGASATASSMGGALRHFGSMPCSLTDSEDDDFDYVSSSEEASSLSEGSDDSDDSDNSDNSDDNDVAVDLLSNEATDLVDDILSDTEDKDSGSFSASTATFIAHSLFNGGGQIPQRGMMTRGMYTQHVGRSNASTHQHLNSPLLFNALTAMFRIRSSPEDYSQPALPFKRHETEALAQLIRTRRQSQNNFAVAATNPAMLPGVETNNTDGSSQPNSSGDAILCVICWANTRCVMLRPCRCLCLCNECRAALAARNFDHCPCCRRDVAGYSRVYAV